MHPITMHEAEISREKEKRRRWAADQSYIVSKGESVVAQVLKPSEPKSTWSLTALTLTDLTLLRFDGTVFVAHYSKYSAPCIILVGCPGPITRAVFLGITFSCACAHFLKPDVTVIAVVHPSIHHQQVGTLLCSMDG